MKSSHLKCLTAFIFILAGSQAFAQQSNFQFMPAPIPYPYFEPNRTDITVGADYFGVSSNDFDIKGGGAHGIFRYAANEVAAIDGGLGLYGLSGEVPGFALPFFFQSSLFIPVIEDKADLSGVTFPMFFNLELQAINKPGGSLIFFGGPNLSFASLTMDTPYHAVSGNTTAVSTTFNTKAIVFLGGGQVGVQAGIKLGSFRLAPFALAIMQGGSASFTFDNGYRSTDQLVETTVVNIEPFVTRVFGGDLIYEPWNLSIGGVFQQANSTDEQAGYKTFLFTLAYHFRGK